MKKVIAGLAMAFLLAVNTGILRGEELVVAKGKTVKFDYTLTVNGEVMDSSKDRGPMEFVVGEGKIIPGLEKQMEGMKVGDAKKIAVVAADAYGVPDPTAVKEFPKSMFPKDMEFKIGMILEMKDAQGRVIPAVVKEVKEQGMVLDFNHPLAGKDLMFDIKIVDIK